MRTPDGGEAVVEECDTQPRVEAGRFVYRATRRLERGVARCGPDLRAPVCEDVVVRKGRKLEAQFRVRPHHRQASECAADAPAATSNAEAPLDADAPAHAEAAAVPVLIGVMGLCYSKQLTWLPLNDTSSGEALFELVTETIQHIEAGGPLPPPSLEEKDDQMPTKRGDASTGSASQDAATSVIENGATGDAAAVNGHSVSSPDDEVAKPTPAKAATDGANEERGCLVA